jgi:hypothetical protein
MHTVTVCFLNFVIISVFCVLTVLFHIYNVARYYCIFFVEYLSEDGRERPKHARGLPHVCTPLYLIAVQVMVCIYIYIYIYVCVCVCVCTSLTAWNMDNFK